MKKKILICTSEFKSEKNFDGGISSHFFRLAKELNQKYDVTVITSSDKSGFFKFDGINVLRVNIFNIFTKFFLKITEKKNFRGEIFARPFFCLIQSYLLNKKISKLINKNSVIIYSSYQYLNLFQNPKWKSIVYIWSFQKDWNFVNPNSIFQKIDTYFENKSFLISKKIISVSKLLTGRINKNFKDKTILIRPLYLPLSTQPDLDIKYEDKLEDNQYFLYFGSMIKRKGIDLIFKILPELINKYPEYKFIFCGSNSKFDGVSKKEILHKFKTKFPNNILIFDSLPQNKLFLLIKNSKIVVMPTYIDTTPSMSLEALDLKAIVLCSSNSSIDEYIINNENGFVFKNGDAEDLLKQIIYINNINEEKIEDIRNKAKDTIKVFFSKKQTVEKLDQLINEI